MKKLVTLALVAMMILSSFVFASAETTYKDTIIYAVGSDQNTLDPAMNTSNQLVLSQVYGTLFKKDAEGKLYGDLATETLRFIKRFQAVEPFTMSISSQSYLMRGSTRPYMRSTAVFTTANIVAITRMEP